MKKISLEYIPGQIEVHYKYASKIEALLKNLKQLPAGRNSIIYSNFARILLEIKKYDLCLQTIELIEVRDGIELFQKIQRLFTLNQFEKVVKEVEAKEELMQQLPPSSFWLIGVAYRYIGDYEKALAYLKDTIYVIELYFDQEKYKEILDYVQDFKKFTIAHQAIKTIAECFLYSLSSQQIQEAIQFYINALNKLQTKDFHNRNIQENLKTQWQIKYCIIILYLKDYKVEEAANWFQGMLETGIWGFDLLKLKSVQKLQKIIVYFESLQDKLKIMWIRKNLRQLKAQGMKQVNQ